MCIDVENPSHHFLAFTLHCVRKNLISFKKRVYQSQFHNDHASFLPKIKCSVYNSFTSSFFCPSNHLSTLFTAHFLLPPLFFPQFQHSLCSFPSLWAPNLQVEYKSSLHSFIHHLGLRLFWHTTCPYLCFLLNLYKGYDFLAWFFILVGFSSIFWLTHVEFFPFSVCVEFWSRFFCH